MTDKSTEELIRAINYVASLDEGRILLAYIHHICKFNTTMVASDSPQQTHFFAAQRSVYTRIRAYIRPEHILAIEHHTMLKTKPTKEKNNATKKGKIKEDDRSKH